MGVCFRSVSFDGIVFEMCGCGYECNIGFDFGNRNFEASLNMFVGNDYETKLLNFKFIRCEFIFCIFNFFYEKCKWGYNFRSIFE